MKKFYCDHCGEELNKPNEYKIYKHISFMGWQKQKEPHLCEDCEEKLDEFFSQGGRK